MLSNLSLFKQPKTNLQIEAQGFTLVESLMGILVITVVAITITPPIVISTATRVQNRRAEQAMQLAQAEVDRIRVLVEQGGAYTAKLPPVPSGIIPDSNIAKVTAPTTFVTTPIVSGKIDTDLSRALANATTKAFGVDVDNDAQVDYYVQIFRDNNSNAIPTGTTTLVAFQLGVRVYSKVARAGSLQILPASLRLTTSYGSQEFSPLAVAYTTVARSDATTVSLEKYKQYLSP
ncbi:type II secretion system GspH family protein [Synechocystis sp. PCC 7509]|uniref:type II secretion system GspH family protein n=1 Tax=Synechocystis sp. PCC 7509 TaxID=927677 RepID=UPI0002AC7D14|nr:type II secretion system GspH family protein [Synechocystis sp. PCC 7509]